MLRRRARAIPDRPRKDKPPPSAEPRDLSKKEMATRSLLYLTALTLGYYFVGPPFLLFLAAIFAILIVHEGGHLIAAKLSGMRVTQAFVGIGPQIAYFHLKSIRFGIRAIPIGAFVMIPGMTPTEKVDEKDEGTTFRSKSYLKKVFVLAGGVGAQILVGFALYVAFLSVFGLATPDPPEDIPPTLDGVPRTIVLPGPYEVPGPAFQAGLRPGDTVTHVNGRPVDSWLDMAEQLSSKDGPSVVEWQTAAGSHRSAVLDPVVIPTRDGGTREVIGIKRERSWSSDPIAPHTALWAISVRAYHISVGTLKSFADLPQRAFSVRDSSPSLSAEDGLETFDASLSDAPVSSLMAVGEELASSDVHNLAAILFAINVVIALLNILPLPVLDGGLIMLETVRETSRRLKAAPSFMIRVQKSYNAIAYAVVFFMALVSVIAVANDVLRYQ